MLYRLHFINTIYSSLCQQKHIFSDINILFSISFFKIHIYLINFFNIVKLTQLYS
nr:MAG TPA_asm: hypothetical protein [Caudoviricetes sp.]